jgi:hypothetical protein
MEHFSSPESENLKIVIENPKGSYKSFTDDKDSTYPLKGVTYPVDYGYIEGYQGEDDAELDVFIGTGSMYGMMTVWRDDVPKETKFISHVTQEEYDAIIETFKPVILSSEILSKEKFTESLYRFTK